MITYNGKVVRSASGKWIGKSTAPQPGAVIGGKTYPTVTMPDGNEWLAVNLDFAWTGLSIPTSGASLVGTPQAMYYNYDESTYGWNGYKCGLLYNNAAVYYMDNNRAELFPGWHIPTITEVQSLIAACGGASVAGTKLKAIDSSASTSWPTSWGGTDDYGFSVLPGGQFVGQFENVGSSAQFWTITSGNWGRKWAYYFNSGASYNELMTTATNQYSVRLVKDA